MLSLAQNYLTRGFWGDEAWTSLISQLPYGDMLKTTAADFHPPAFYTVIELVYKFLPPTEVVTRLISIFFFLLTVLMVYKLASEIRGKTFGIWSAVAVFVNPIFFRYAFEARNYTMFAFCATASIYFLVRISAHPRGELGNDLAHPGGVIRDFILFIFFTTLGIYTHYYMFFVLGAQGLYLLFFDRKILFKMIGAYFVVGILYLGWIPFLLHQLTSVKSSFWIGTIDFRHTHYEALVRILGGETQSALQIWLFRICAILIGVGLVQHIRQKSFEKPYILIWLWAIVPFVLATLPGLTVFGFHFPFRPIFFWRYLIPASVPLSLVVVHASQKLHHKLFVFSVGVVILLGLVIDFQTFTSYPYNFKQVYASDVIPRIQPSDKIVTVLPSFAEVLYYRNRNHLKNDVVVLPEGLVQFSGKSLLDAYSSNGSVLIDEAPDENHFELRPGPTVFKVEVRF